MTLKKHNTNIFLRLFSGDLLLNISSKNCLTDLLTPTQAPLPKKNKFTPPSKYTHQKNELQCLK